MVLFILFLMILFIFDVIALRWGYDSRDSIRSQEWGLRDYRGSIY
jgi:hypothetical protein